MRRHRPDPGPIGMDVPTILFAFLFMWIHDRWRQHKGRSPIHEDGHSSASPIAPAITLSHYRREYGRR